MNAYLVNPEFKTYLKNELSKVSFFTDDIIFAEDKVQSIWSLDTFYDVQILEFTSIKDAATKLKNLAPIWMNLSQSHHRRSQLIQDNLRSYKVKPLQFLEKRLPKKIGVWGLLDQNKLFLSTYTDCPILGGAIQFVEDKNIPPSRAYLKLWELMTVYGFKPKSSETVLDMGSCPGGWSWVLSNVAKTVVSVDKAPLDDAIAKIPNIKFLKKDAFKLEPSEVGPVHWFFSDIICEPMRSYELVEKWMPFVDNFVCTVKFKGKADSQAVKKFQQLQPNLLKHLYNNKHEITFVKIKNS